MRLPLERDPQHPFDPPAGLRGLPPMTRLELADGHLGWLATTHEAARTVLADPRFSARQDLRRAAVRATVPPGAAPPPGFFVAMDPPAHTRYRRLLTGRFTVRRMRLLEPRIERVAADHLDAMAAAGPPADLVPAYALPIPSLVICELLGVPYADHDFFQDRSTRLALPGRDAQGATADLAAYLTELVGRKRKEPGDDLLSELTGELTDEEATNVALILLVAGHETTANMIALGVFALLHEGLAYEEDAAAGAEEELLRWLSVVHLGVPARAAPEDVEVAGVTVRKGETVALSLPAINRDPAMFEDPEALRLDRAEARRHLAFGHGVHQCLGQQLARIEMRIGYRALFGRFPDLRLAVPATEVPLRTDAAVYGVASLPVTWITGSPAG
ncbi:cytochrome P450 [Nonomuraea salmonea]|uniref:Cytochrome P450 n=2 Tax=Nonomuraea salmonea TaxID=46181 RepID=A0ABV5NP84_9ACTN